MKPGVTPHARVVARGSVKHATLALRAHPSPRFRLGVRIARHRVAHHQHRAILRVMFRVKIRFVPRLKCLHAFHRRMFAVGNARAKHRPLMALEPPTHQLIEAWFIAETPARAVHRYKSAAVLHVVFQVFPLMRLDRAVVRVQQQHVKLAEILRITQRLLDAHRVIKIDRIPPQCLGQHGVVLVGVVMLRRMPEEQHANRPRLR